MTDIDVDKPIAHPQDILVVGYLAERQFYPQFASDQVFSVSRVDRMQGRRFRTAWVTAAAKDALQWARAESVLHHRAVVSNGQVLPIALWKSEPPTLADLIRLLPELNATQSRDFGRGYSKAVRDVLELIEGAA